MPELAITLPARSGRMGEIAGWAREAEARGFAGLFATEAVLDSLVVSLTAALATQRAAIGTAISNIYYRHPALAAGAVSQIHELSKGRFILGLGTSHRLINAPRGIEMGRPVATVRAYVEAMRRHAGAMPLPPIYLGALRKGMARLAGEIADGVIFNMVPRSRFHEAVRAVREGEARRKDGRKNLRITSFMGICVAGDLAAARTSARKMIAFYYRMEYYRNQAAGYGYGEQAERAGRALERNDEAGALAAISDEMVDELFIAGQPRRCLEQLEAWRAAGLELPILSARDVNGDMIEGFRAAVQALGKG